MGRIRIGFAVVVFVCDLNSSVLTRITRLCTNWVTSWRTCTKRSRTQALEMEVNARALPRAVGGTWAARASCVDAFGA